MKKQLSKKLSAFIVIAMMFSAITNAQIIYTDVNPDIIFNTGNSPYYLDLNNDGTNDFVIVVVSTSAGSCSNLGFKTNYHTEISPLNNNKVLCDGSAFPKALNQNVTVGSGSSPWSYPSYPLFESRWQCEHVTYHYYWKNFTSGLWGTTADKYVGLKLQVGNNKYYGWLRMIAGSSLFTIKDYAYDSTPNHSILSGATSGATPLLSNENAIDERTVSNDPPITESTVHCNCSRPNWGCLGSDFNCYMQCRKYCSTHRSQSGQYESNLQVEEVSLMNIFPNPATTSVTLQLPSTEESTVDVVNPFGQIVFSEKIKGEQTQIDVSRFPAGMYVVRWSNGEDYSAKTFSVIK